MFNTSPLQGVASRVELPRAAFRESRFVKGPLPLGEKRNHKIGAICQICNILIRYVGYVNPFQGHLVLKVQGSFRIRGEPPGSQLLVRQPSGAFGHM